MRPGLTASPARAGVFATLLLALMALAAALIAMPAGAQTFPKFTGFVVDDAGILPPEVQASLTQKLEALQRDTKRQLVVVTVKDLQGYPIEDYSNKLFRSWGVGLKDVNNGALFVIAPNDRKLRIEVGYGLEPFLTDALSSVIINNDVVPRFKAGDMPGGITAGTDAIIAQLRASPEEAQARLDAAVKQFDQTHRAQRSGGGGVPIGLIFWGMVMLFVLLSFARRGGRGQRYGGDGSGALPIVLWSIANEIGRQAMRGGGGGGWGGGDSGGGGGGWGGGGFGGGGGGSSGGGGASGGW
ncbi:MULTISPECIES: YgcG family protein [unclassified Sphingomonas]|uniref:TPM domain-containing protein n=1 Tax=unclassified Sphingomonas TaxID=196159 RepID=UPI0009274012|nr:MULTISPECIES: TPM domain-containing protein [unclassified Sphingomonas]MBN8849282.1 TPM domain-containing protein [Sphingomonas sp.]OJV30020.1 MAG: methanol dehydrogenase [Sphingomonas sp. 67-36]